jgi:hypothetical protein
MNAIKLVTTSKIFCSIVGWPLKFFLGLVFSFSFIHLLGGDLTKLFNTYDYMLAFVGVVVKLSTFWFAQIF